MTPAGHHIQFEILEQDVGTIKFGELPKETTDEVVGIEYLLPYTIQGANGDTIHDGGYFQYQIMTMGGEVLVEPERALGKRRKQRWKRWERWENRENQERVRLLENIKHTNININVIINVHKDIEDKKSA